MSDKKQTKGQSLILRVGLLSTLWVVVALLVIVFVSALIYREANERNFERLLTAHLYSLVGFVNVDAEGYLQGTPELGDIRYHDPNAGWYWEVISLGQELRPSLKSPSMETQDIASPPESVKNFDAQFTRFYQSHGLRGEKLLIIESDIVLENVLDPEANMTARFRIMGNMAELEAQFDDFWRVMRWYLLAFALLSIAINAISILFGLRPLKRVRRAIAAIRAGQATHVDENLPLEIQPLAREMNALIDNNRHIVERFRLQLGNLAHALKTPLAVILNEAATMPENHGRLIADEATAMRDRIEHYLQRARIAAQSGSVVYRTPVLPLLERLLRVIAKLYPHHRITSDIVDNDICFAGESQDLEEMIGNLLENAGKWAKNRIHVTLKPVQNEKQHTTSFTVIIEDDGVGLNAQEIEQVQQRGRRLDENVPGSGLGLSIVVDMVRDYEGNFILEASKLGGLRACLILPHITAS